MVAVAGGALAGAFVGLVLILAGLISGRAQRARQRGWLRVPGEVVALVPGDINPGMYHPVARYQRADGSVGQVRDSPATQPPRFRVGDRVQVSYDPADPAQARIGAGGASIVPGALIGLGALVVVLAIAIGVASSAAG